MRHWTFAGLICVVLTLAVTGSAKAQQPVPPEHYTLDVHGVDLISGRFVYQTPEVSVGQPGAGGLTYGRMYMTPSTGGGNWRMSVLGTINVSGSTVTVSVGSDSELFTLSGGVYTPASNSGATLTKPSGYVFTTSSGTVVRLGLFSAITLTPYVANTALIESITTPSGEVTTYNYMDDLYCPNPAPEAGECMGALAPISRLQSITTNRGYMLHFQYAYNDPLLDKDGWLKLDKVTGLNLAVDYCDPTAISCSGLTRTWPSVTYADVTAGTTATDESGRVTTYLSPGFKIRYPGSTVDDVSVALTSAKVSSVTDASGAWAYAYSTSGTTQTTVATGPLGESTTVIANLTTGRATSVGILTATTPSPVTQTTSYAYDTQRRLIRITQPEGNKVDYTLDARSNVTTTTVTDKAATSTIVTSSAYPGSCSNPVTCNRPTSTTDARGNQTDYVWNATHGGLESVTSPVAGDWTSIRPQTRISYAAQTAYALNGLGGFAALSPSIMLPVSRSACAANAAPACLGTTDETKTTIVYGASGAANNLLPTSTTSGDGLATGGLKVTTAMTYDPNGDVQTVDGPLSGSNDTSRFVYDTARQRVGAMGPDPDGGSSPLLNRAQRLTYNPRGQVTLTEAGTTTGNGAGDWSSFSTLQRQATDYDVYGRPVVARQQDASGATLALQQVGYDAAGRTDCVATRMNPGTFSGLPGSTGACVQTTSGAFGPDRIFQTVYDVADRPRSTISGVGSGSTITESVTYTPNGSPQSLTDGNGNVSTYAYDGFDRVYRQCYPGAASCSASTPTDYEQYGYDAASNVISRRDRAGHNFGMFYDNLNRFGSIYSTDTPATIAQRFYAYDNLSRPTYTQLASGAPWRTDWNYDALGRTTAEHVWNTSSSVTTSVFYGYDAASRRTSITWPDAFVANYDYDLASDLTAVRENGATTGPGVLATYGYDNLGRRTTISRGNGAGSAYGYDGVSRLSSLTQNPAGAGQDLSLGFTYNPASQILTRSASNSAYVYAPANASTAYANNGLNQVTGLTGTGATSIGYDANQNLTTGLGLTYGYDALNQLTSAGTSTFTYDPVGRLYRSVGATDRRFLYEGQQVIGEYDATGAMTARYVPGLGLDDVVASYAGSGVTNRTWLLSDERQSVVALTDGSGVAGTLNTYDEYGVPASGNVGRFQYTGQMWMPDATLYHYRARAYAPQIGRFLQTDPSGYSEGMNLYGYVSGDPINWADPSGLGKVCNTDGTNCRWIDDNVVTGERSDVIVVFPRWDETFDRGFSRPPLDIDMSNGERPIPVWASGRPESNFDECYIFMQFKFAQNVGRILSPSVDSSILIGRLLPENPGLGIQVKAGIWGTGFQLAGDAGLLAWGDTSLYNDVGSTLIAAPLGPVLGALSNAAAVNLPEPSKGTNPCTPK